jgi:hypothetical protein
VLLGANDQGSSVVVGGLLRLKPADRRRFDVVRRELLATIVEAGAR